VRACAGWHNKTRSAGSAHAAESAEHECLMSDHRLPQDKGAAVAASPVWAGRRVDCAASCGTSAGGLVGWTIVQRKRKRGVFKTLLLTPLLAREYAPSNDSVLNRHLPGACHETRPPVCVISISPVVTPLPRRDSIWLIEMSGITDHPARAQVKTGWM